MTQGQPDSHAFTELAELASALCDGEITRAQAARLEQLACATPEATRFFLDYLFLHGELCWEPARQSTPEAADGFQAESSVAVSALPASPASKPRRSRWISWVATASAACLFLLGIALPFYRTKPAATSPTRVAEVVRSWNADWASGTSRWKAGDSIGAGDTIAVDAGLVELAFPGGTRVLLEGPARATVVASDRARLALGRLTLRNQGGRALTLETDMGSFRDLGTEFGVWVQGNRQTTLCVWEGAVEVLPSEGQFQTVAAGKAVMLARRDGGASVSVAPTRVPADAFVRQLPGWANPPSTAALRRVAAGRQDLIHHYPFEGDSIALRRRDVRGHWDLSEAVMADGRGDGRVAYDARSVDLSAGAIRPFRDAADGNTRGVSLQTEMQFLPPRAMTVELLARVAEGTDPQDGRIACAVATRGDADHCGFYLVAAEDLTLAMLLDADAPWAETSLKLVPGQWYYLACTWEAVAGDSKKTSVHCYAANVSAGERSVREVFGGEIPGRPPASRLGVGKGFDASGAHAYPWCGSLDEVAVYASAWNMSTVQSHLDALWQVGGPQ